MSRKEVKPEVCATCQHFCEVKGMSEKGRKVDGSCLESGEPTGKEDTCGDHLIIV